MMNRIDQLIAKLCPNGVEFKTFLECGTYIRGITYNKSQEINSNNEGRLVLRANNINLSTNTLLMKDVKKVSMDVKVSSKQLLKKNDILICAGSGSREHIGKVAFVHEDMNVTFGGFMAVLRVKDVINSKYLFHILTGREFKRHLEKCLNSSTINNLNSGIVNSFVIPVPPLPVQEEIVRILDRFTELETELEAELEARKKQYEYYRDKLLTFK